MRPLLVSVLVASVLTTAPDLALSRPGAATSADAVSYAQYGRRDRRPAYQVWRRGDVMPSAYTGKRYAIRNYWDYDLRAPPPGHRWVRYADDAILVNRKTGLIVSIERNIFG